MLGVLRPALKSLRNFVQGSGLGMSYLLNLAISEILGCEKCKWICRLTISCVLGPDKWGGKAEKSYGLESVAGRPKNHMVWGVGRHCKKMNKSKTNKTQRALARRFCFVFELFILFTVPTRSPDHMIFRPSGPTPQTIWFFGYPPPTYRAEKRTNS